MVSSSLAGLKHFIDGNDIRRGIGERLRKITENIPKALLEVNGKNP